MSIINMKNIFQGGSDQQYQMLMIVCIRESLRIDKFVKVGVPGDTDKSK